MIEETDEGIIPIAILGGPKVGKSVLFSALSRNTGSPIIPTQNYTPTLGVHNLKIFDSKCSKKDQTDYLRYSRQL